MWATFQGRYANVLAAKQEVLKLGYYRKLRSNGALQLDSEQNFQVLAHDAATLDEVVKPGSVDYIFTDPPYGGFITSVPDSAGGNRCSASAVLNSIASRTPARSALRCAKSVIRKLTSPAWTATLGAWTRARACRW